jgi:hypothetical protein
VQKVKALELELAEVKRRLTVTENERNREVKRISDALNETRGRLEEAKSLNDKVLQEKVTRIWPPDVPQTSSPSSARRALASPRPYVCVIIDGDANHFLPELLKGGRPGGELAAQRVKEEVFKFVAARPQKIPQTCKIKLQMFMNRSGYVETIHKHHQIAKQLIDGCLDRFFQTQPLWDLVDTGGLRESADTKVKGTSTLSRRSAYC